MKLSLILERQLLDNPSLDEYYTTRFKQYQRYIYWKKVAQLHRNKIDSCYPYRVTCDLCGKLGHTRLICVCSHIRVYSRDGSPHRAEDNMRQDKPKPVTRLQCLAKPAQMMPIPSDTLPPPSQYIRRKSYIYITLHDCT